MQEKPHTQRKGRLTPIDVYKLTPKTNCNDCGLGTCLSFASHVIAAQAELDWCPHLQKDALESARIRLVEQHKAGIGLKREGFEPALEYLRGRINEEDLQSLAPTLGAVYLAEVECPGLEFDYFGEKVFVSAEEVRTPSGEEVDPWEKILLYNYVIGGATEPSGVWVGMEGLPNSVSKIKSLKAHCEDRLAKAFAAKLVRLPQVTERWGREITAELEQVDFAAEFPVLPKLNVRVLWWDEDPQEGFDCRVKFLFDSRVLETLDLESLLFTCEQLTERLMSGSSP